MDLEETMAGGGIGGRGRKREETRRKWLTLVRKRINQ